MKKKVLAVLLSVMTFLCCLSGAISVEAAEKIKAPTGVSVKTGKKGNPIISWKKVKKASKYRVYRKTANDTSWLKVKTTSKLKVTDSKWKAKEGTTIQYVIKAYIIKDGKKVWSKKSKKVKWTVPGNKNGNNENIGLSNNTGKNEKKIEKVSIDTEHFPDANFREYIGKAFDDDGDGYLSESEIELIWNVHCENMDIYSVKGIEYFPELKGLWCKGNHISELDLSGNPGLKGIWCSFNDFTSLDFSDCPELEWVYCFNCKLETLNIRNNPEMAYLECNANPNLKSLDLSQNSKLENLFCSNCGLTSLDLSNNPLLCELAAFYNDLEEIDVSGNPNLKRFDIWHNPRLGNVDVSKLTGLQYYNCAWTGLTEIDVSKNTELLELVCGYNSGLRTLDLSHNPKLAYFACECDVSLESLDLSHNPRLYYLLAFGLSSIDKIDISNNSRLCKAYKEGEYVHETENLGYVYSKTIDYGGSSDPFDELRHCVCFDDGTKIIGKYKGKNDVTDSVVDTSDGSADTETFVTRAEAIQALYLAAGSPAVKGSSRFTDVADGASYAKAVKWGEDHKLCFGYPNISSDTFCPDEPVSRQDFALMAHRFADHMGFGTAFDYGRTDWFSDFYDIDFYAWGPFTWAIQWRVLSFDAENNTCYPHGRMTKAELKAGLAELFDLDEGASYSAIVGGNEGDPNGN